MLRIIAFNTKPDAPTNAKLFMENIYKHHGLPLVTISDRDSIFMSKFWRSLLNSLGTKIAPSWTYLPETDGRIETLNHKIEEMIREFANHDTSNLDKHLIHFEVAYISFVHSATTYTPFSQKYGQHPRTLPIETLEASKPSA